MFSHKFSQKDLKKVLKKDAGDLIQTVIIVSGVAVMCIVGLVPIGQSLASQAQEQNSCMSGSSNFVSSNFGNSCGEGTSGVAQLVVTPGINDPYPVEQPTPTPTTTTTPVPTPTPTPAEDINITPVALSAQSTISLDLRKFASAAQDLADYTGKYPSANTSDLKKLDFGATVNAYPKNSPLNLEYCTTTNASDYVLSTYLGDNKVLYISNRSTTAKIYTLSQTPKTNESLCESSAQKAGLAGKMNTPITGISIDNLASTWVQGKNSNA